jgi:integrase
MRRLPGGSEIMRLLEEHHESQREERRQHVLTDAQIAKRKLHADQLAEAKRQKLIDHEDDVIPVPYDDLVFTRANGDPLLLTSDTQDWKQILKDAGLPHTRVYVSRHTALSHLIRGGANLVDVSIFGGHSDAAFTQRSYISNVDTRTDGLKGFFDRG